MERSKLFKRGFLALPVAIGFFAGVPAFGGTILYDNLLANPSFEVGNQAGGCPTGWTCGGSPAPGFTSYLITSAQYTAGSDGLSGGKLVPDGTHVGSSPVPAEGSGLLSQTGLGTYVAGNTYTVDLWIGTPNTLPIDGVTPVGPVGVIKIDFLGNSSLAILTVNATVPVTGQWTLEQFSFTPTGSQIGQTIGLMIEVVGQPQSGGSDNNRIANFDIAPATVPEPASIGLFGLSLVGIGLASRKKFKKNL